MLSKILGLCLVCLLYCVIICIAAGWGSGHCYKQSQRAVGVISWHQWLGAWYADLL